MIRAFDPAGMHEAEEADAGRAASAATPMKRWKAPMRS